MTQSQSLALSEKEVRILTYLFNYRGMRAKDLVVFETNTTRYSLSNEKSIYNYLAKLKRKGLIKSNRLQGVNSLGSLYYLSSTGLELVKNQLNISVGRQGNGFLPIMEETTFWDIPAEYQSPPLKQTEHFLLTIEFFKQLVADKETPYRHTTTFYSNLTYVHEQKMHKVKPDAAVIIDGNFYAVEIDRATENHEQLIQKFLKYKHHYDYCNLAEDKTTVRPVHSILFVVEERSRRHGIQRRWTNVLSAFFKAFDEEFPEINLILVPMNEVAATLDFEQSRHIMEKNKKEELFKLYSDRGFNNIVNQGTDSLFVDKNNKCIVVTLQIHQEFESRLYKDKYDLSLSSANIANRFKQDERLSEYEFIGTRGFWLNPYNTPKMVEGIENTGLHSEFIKKLNILPKQFELYASNQFDKNKY